MRVRRLAVITALVSVFGLLVPSTAHADGSNLCKFSSFPNAPGYFSEFAIGCFYTSATFKGGTRIIDEDFPQAVWHTGAARGIVATTATASGSKVITSASGHFGPADINND